MFFLKQATFYVSTVSCSYLITKLNVFLLMSSLSILSEPYLPCYCHYIEQLSTQHVEVHEINQKQFTESIMKDLQQHFPLV